jgi:hypothetical protein
MTDEWSGSRASAPLARPSLSLSRSTASSASTLHLLRAAPLWCSFRPRSGRRPQPSQAVRLRMCEALSIAYLVQVLRIPVIYRSRFEDRYMGATMLARLPFWFGLGRVMDAIVIFRPLRPICILVCTRILFCFMYDLNLCMYIWILTRGVFVVISYILLWVPS